MFKLIYVLFLSILLCSCSTTIKDFFSSEETAEKRNEKLVAEEFSEHKEVLEKFKVTKTPPPVTKKEQDPGPRVAAPPKKINRTLKKKKKSNKKKAEVSKKTPEKKQENPEEQTKQYPEDFPEDLKDLDRDSEDFWQTYKPYLFEGEKIVLNITYLGVSTGKITIMTKQSSTVGQHPVYHVHARVKTADFYSYLYEIDDYCDSYIKKDGFLPLKFSLIQRESSQDIDDLQFFDHEALKVHSFYKRVTDKKKKKEKKTEPIPKYFQDPLSIVYFVRGLPMDPKIKYQVPIINQADVEMFTAQYEKTEILSTEIGKMKAYRVKIHTKAKGETIKGGAMTFWFSADEKRVFLKFEAEIKIGSISGEIESYN